MLLTDSVRNMNTYKSLVRGIGGWFGSKIDGGIMFGVGSWIDWIGNAGGFRFKETIVAILT